MRTILEPARRGAVAATRVLFLPAAFTGPEDFIEADFAGAVRRRMLQIDLVFADMKLQHLSDRTMLRRLRHELVLPARAEGCVCVWICGISLGGYVALAYAERYSSEIDGLCLLAPYLGNYIVTGEIERAHGLDSWQPGELAQDDEERRLWRFIKSHRNHSVRLHLGFGQEDRFAHSHRMMAHALRPEQVDTVPGGHEWPVWRELWENFLDTRVIAATELGEPLAVNARPRS